MPKGKRVEAGNTIHIAIIFVTFVTALLAVAFFIKLGLLIQSSHFDGSDRFTIAITSPKDQASTQKNAEIISFSPTDNSASVLRIRAGIPIDYLERYLEIPIDGTITDASIDPAEHSDLGSIFNNLIIHFGGSKTKLTFLDILRTRWFEKTLTPHSITDQTFIRDSSLSFDTQVDQIDQDLFTDSAILSEKLSIAIVNGAGIPGFGNRMSRLIANIGGNVVSVSTSDNPISKTTIVYRGAKTYTVTKLEKIIGVTAEKGESDISDIMVSLGTDRKDTRAF